MRLEEVLNVRKLVLACGEDWTGFLVETTHNKVNLCERHCGGSC